MGSGGMIVMDERTCMVDVAKYFMSFLKDESCGKCFTCREGTQRMYEILEDISDGKGTTKTLNLLKELALVVKDSTMCGLGHGASNPVLSTINYFRDEYIEHIENHRCPAGVCKELITYTINDNCNGCMLCLRSCPEDAISGKKKEPHVIDQVKCIKCGACMSVCKFEAVDVR
jgi:ferredoxin